MVKKKRIKKNTNLKKNKKPKKKSISKGRVNSEIKPLIKNKPETILNSDDIKIVAKTMLPSPKTKIKNIRRIPTGVKNFDKMIGKGFMENSTNLIIGGAGSGKTIFAMQFLIEGMKKNEKCLYISFDEKKDSFYGNMREIGWDLEKLEKQNKFFFLEYTPQKIKVMLEEGGGTIENIVLSKKITRIAIDSLTSFLFLFKDEIEEREATLSLIDLLRRWNCTTILTYEGNPSRENKPMLKTSSRILELESDSIILIYFLRNKNERVRYLEILKIKGVKHPTGIFPFTINKGGIEISKKSFKGELKI